MTAQTVSKKNQSLKCSQEVRNIPLERFRLPHDGRKWKQAARSRRAFLLLLAGYANPNGTFVKDGRNYSPSLKTLLKHIARASYTRHSDDLYALGLLSWIREKSFYGRRVYKIHLPAIDSPENTSHSQENSAHIHQEQCSHSQENSAHHGTANPRTVLTTDTETVLTMVPNPSSYSVKREEPREEPSRSLNSVNLGGQEIEELLEAIKTAAKMVDSKARFSPKHSSALRNVLQSVRFTRTQVETATRKIVSGLDEFELRHAGSHIAEELSATINAAEIQLVREKATQRMRDADLEQAAKEREKREAEIAEHRKDDERWNALSEKEQQEALFGGTAA